MEVVSLNCWYGKEWSALQEYIAQRADDTQVFLFQEVSSFAATMGEPGKFRLNLLGDLKRLLMDFECFYQPTSFRWDANDLPTNLDLYLGMATFVHKRLPIIRARGTVLCSNGMVTKVEEDGSNAPIGVQGVTVSHGLSFFNFHGTYEPGDKLDTPRRLEQSRELLEFMKRFSGPHILGGDFNLMPETKSIGMIEEAGYRNLIKEWGVKCTGTSLGKFWDTPNRQMFADYAFVSPGILVEDFEAEDVLVSDHRPLRLSFCA